jgi:hypothetical protein
VVHNPVANMILGSGPWSRASGPTWSACVATGPAWPASTTPPAGRLLRRVR